METHKKYSQFHLLLLPQSKSKHESLCPTYHRMYKETIPEGEFRGATKPSRKKGLRAGDSPLAFERQKLSQGFSAGEHLGNKEPGFPSHAQANIKSFRDCGSCTCPTF